MPVLAKLETFFADALARLPGKSDLAAAMRYATSRWAALEVSNNAVGHLSRSLGTEWVAGSVQGDRRAPPLQASSRPPRSRGGVVARRSPSRSDSTFTAAG